MSYECDICSKDFKSASGLAGHKQMAHGNVVKRQLPDSETLAEFFETALDGIGQVREGLDGKLATISRALAALQTQQQAIVGAQKHENLKPTAALLDHWARCEGCYGELAHLQPQLAGLLPAPAPTPPEPLQKRWQASTGGRSFLAFSGFGK
ncbi:MAG: hypothetical protein WCD72_02645 [Dehalococcoidia bacterium]